MADQLEPIARMVNQLSRLPGVGKKSAQRLAYFLIDLPIEDVKNMVSDIYEGRKAIRYCSICGNYSVEDKCNICKDTKRNDKELCVVRDPRDVLALERMHDFHGRYHVLHGTLSPMDGIGPDDIRINELISRVKGSTIEEVIIATNPDVEGEATATYISRLLKSFGIKVTRIAHGVPIGSDLEYTDEMTLAKAMEGRREM